MFCHSDGKLSHFVYTDELIISLCPHLLFGKMTMRSPFTIPFSVLAEFSESLTRLVLTNLNILAFVKKKLLTSDLWPVCGGL